MDLLARITGFRRHRLPTAPPRERSRSRSRDKDVHTRRWKLSQEEKQRILSDGYNEAVERAAVASGYKNVVGNAVYLDFAGAAPVSVAHSQRAEALILQAPPGNPHSSPEAAQHLDAVRARVLEYFNASPDEHIVVFTQNATGAIRLVDEYFPYGEGSVFAYDIDSHTSVLGMRQRAQATGTRIGYYDSHCVAALSESLQPLTMLDGAPPPTSIRGPCLLAVTAESNFTGNCADLSCLNKLRTGPCGWRVLLDAAKFAATTPLDLTRTPADFVAVSFYKMFGRPTGLGALVVRKDASKLLERGGSGGGSEGHYFGGGTIAGASASSDYVIPAARLEERLSFGTSNFLAIAELPAAFEETVRLHGGLLEAGRHARSLAREAMRRMRTLVHTGARRGIAGSPVCEIYGRWMDSEIPADQGPTVSFNVLDNRGDYFPFGHIDRVARKHGVQLRVGQLCNYGACEKYLGLTPDRLRRAILKGHTCRVPVDVVDDRPTGVVRISFGPTSGLRDVDRILECLETFIDKVAFMEVMNFKEDGDKTVTD